MKITATIGLDLTMFVCAGLSVAIVSGLYVVIVGWL